MDALVGWFLRIVFELVGAAVDGLLGEKKAASSEKQKVNLPPQERVNYSKLGIAFFSVSIIACGFAWAAGLLIGSYWWLSIKSPYAYHTLANAFEMLSVDSGSLGCCGLPVLAVCSILISVTYNRFISNRAKLSRDIVIILSIIISFSLGSGFCGGILTLEVLTCC